MFWQNLWQSQYSYTPRTFQWHKIYLTWFDLLGSLALPFQHLPLIAVAFILADLTCINVKQNLIRRQTISAVRALTGSNSDVVTGGRTQHRDRAMLSLNVFLNLMQLFSQPFSGHMLNIKEMLSHFTPHCSSSHFSRCSAHYPNTHFSSLWHPPAVPKNHI